MASHRFAGFAVAVASLAPAACLEPNPFYDPNYGQDEVDTEESVGTTTETETETDVTETDSSSETEEPDHCGNGVQDDDETSLDCGGSCDPCADGEPCQAASDCQSQICDGTCQAPTCDDEVQNGEEVGTDCGGPCIFCEYTSFINEFDDFEGTNAQLPRVTMFEDGSFAISYVGGGTPRGRWFDADASAMGQGLELGVDLSYKSGAIPLGNDEPEQLTIDALLAGSSENDNLYLLRHDPEDNAINTLEIDYEASNAVSSGDLVVSGDRVTVAWEENNQILLRRWDYGIGGGAWIDIQPFEAESEPGSYWGEQPALTLGSDGVMALAWVRCVASANNPCDVVARRFDIDWIDPDPVIVTTNAEAYAAPDVARDPDGRTMLVWTRLDLGANDVTKRLLDEDFTPLGEPAHLQLNADPPVESAITYLPSDSFAVAWTDNDNERVHLRRFLSDDDNSPKLPDLGDEAPWPDSDNPNDVAMAATDGRLIVVWSGIVDSVTQVQGQVLSY
ncbi:hypothetical protein G6O69_21555 [Pseudenhygromyxa sp. WMMC2535]|uniref:hypothetical protein n=1 Tax=Pseudenhygromyxa sp. WMMC2535 TaxID=2712867 RepID=UPI001552BA54|nr:hypothetical protein [Pseudenhygromyxa sp. WMMC2535]NVB40441.1 hypothetical protein [Pseudenhygromyxa sp. WMMC2535]